MASTVYFDHLRIQQVLTEADEILRVGDAKRIIFSLGTIFSLSCCMLRENVIPLENITFFMTVLVNIFIII